MVKLFVGNLHESIDSTKLLAMFAPYCKVTECDVLKNYAFVHIEDEGIVDEIIKRFDGHVLEGRAIHIERSTSRLRKQPGMGDKCFRCGATEHKTANCPYNEKNDALKSSTIKIDLTNTGNKRPYSGSTMDAPPAKQSTHGYFVNQPMGVTGQQMPAPGAVDQEIQRPMHADLQPLYDQYAEARARYMYFKDRLLKEMQTRSMGGAPQSLMAQPLSSLTVPLTQQLAAQPVTYVTQTAPGVQTTWNTAPQMQSIGGTHPYAATTALKAPYSVGGMTQQPSAPYATVAVVQNPAAQQVLLSGQPPQTVQYLQAQPVQGAATYAPVQSLSSTSYQMIGAAPTQQATYQPTAVTYSSAPTSVANGTVVSGSPGNYRW